MSEQVYTAETHEALSGIGEFAVLKPAHINNRRFRGLPGERVKLPFPFKSGGRHLKLEKVIEEPTPIGGKKAAPKKKTSSRKSTKAEAKVEETKPDAEDVFAADV